jgi:hypothetical protein
MTQDVISPKGIVSQDLCAQGWAARTRKGRDSRLTFREEHLVAVPVNELAWLNGAAICQQDGSPAAGAPHPFFLQTIGTLAQKKASPLILRYPCPSGQGLALPQCPGELEDSERHRTTPDKLAKRQGAGRRGGGGGSQLNTGYRLPVLCLASVPRQVGTEATEEMSHQGWQLTLHFS